MAHFNIDFKDIHGVNGERTALFDDLMDTGIGVEDIRDFLTELEELIEGVPSRADIRDAKQDVSRSIEKLLDILPAHVFDDIAIERGVEEMFSVVNSAFDSLYT